MKDTNLSDNALIQKPDQQPGIKNINSDDKTQETQEMINDGKKAKDDNDKKYDEQNKDRSWQGGKEEEIDEDRPDKQTDDSDEKEKMI